MKQHAALILTTVLLLGGCGSESAAPSSNKELLSSMSVTEENESVERLSPGGILPTADTEAEPVLCYINTNTGFSEPYRPSIMFYEDNTFVMRENLYSGMGEYRGTYSFDGAYYDCEVTSTDFSGFEGDDVTAFSFLNFDADNLILLDNLCGSRERDVFLKDKDLSETAPQPTSPAQKTPLPTTNPDALISPDAQVFKNSNEDFSDPYCPTLYLNPDDSFVLVENLYEGMGHYYGSYFIDGINLYLHVYETDFYGYAGDNVEDMRFEFMSDYLIQSMMDLCGSKKFDYWYLEE